VLTAAEDHFVAAPNFSAEGEAQCDEEGGAYFHVGNGQSYMDPTMLKLGRSADDHRLFKVPSESADKSTLGFSAFSVTPGGQLWILGILWSGEVPFVEAYGFDADGEVGSHIRFEVPPRFLPRQFAAFDNDVFFLAGEISEGDKEHRTTTPFAGMYDASGRLGRKLELDLGSIRVQKNRLPEGAAVPARDGNLYLLLEDRLVVISQSGALVRSMPFKKRDPEAVASHLQLSGGQAAIWFEKARKTGPIELELLLMDASTGEELRWYSPSQELGNNAICYSRKEGFLFLKFGKASPEGSVELLTALPR
jgi:hypothetical protein